MMRRIVVVSVRGEVVAFCVGWFGAGFGCVFASGEVCWVMMCGAGVEVRTVRGVSELKAIIATKTTIAKYQK